MKSPHFFAVLPAAAFWLSAAHFSTFAGTGRKGFEGNEGLEKETPLSGPKGVAIAKNGNVCLVEGESGSIRKEDARMDTLELIVGTRDNGNGPDGEPLRYKFARTHGVLIDAHGALSIGNTETNRLRLVRK